MLRGWYHQVLEQNRIELRHDRGGRVRCHGGSDINSGKVRFWARDTLLHRGDVEAGVAIRKVSFSADGRYVETDRGILNVDSSSDPARAFFVTRDWVKRGDENILWLPDGWEAVHVATLGREVVLGHATGAISFITLA
jgi:hypothetical protein